MRDGMSMQCNDGGLMLGIPASSIEQRSFVLMFTSGTSNQCLRAKYQLFLPNATGTQLRPCTPIVSFNRECYRYMFFRRGCGEA